MTTRPGWRLALALTIGAVLTLGAATPAGAGKSPSFLLQGGDHWSTHDSGYPVVLGPAEVNLGKRTLSGALAANVHPDDGSMPAPASVNPPSPSFSWRTLGPPTHGSAALVRSVASTSRTPTW